MTSRALVAVALAAVCSVGCSPVSPEPDSDWSPTVTTGPAPAFTTVQQLCDVQSWPRALPSVVDQLLNQAKDGALECFDNIKAIAPDGHDPLNHPAKPAEKTYRIIAVSPAVGTLIGRHDQVTIDLADVDSQEPERFRPCDWVTTAEAAGILGGPVTAEPLGDLSGSVDIACIYDKPRDVGEGVEVNLELPGAFPVDAASQYILATSVSHPIVVDGVGVKAACVDELTTTPPSMTLVVLLEGDRLLRVTQGYGQCGTLKRFAQLAIGRMGR